RDRRGTVEAGDVQTVDQVLVLAGGAVKRGRRLQEAFRASDVDFAQRDAGQHLGDGPDVGAVRQRLERVARDDRLPQGRRRVEEWRFTADGDAFGQGSDFELEIGARGDVRVHHDAALLGGAESLQLGFDAVGAGR